MPNESVLDQHLVHPCPPGNFFQHGAPAHGPLQSLSRGLLFVSQQATRRTSRIVQIEEVQPTTEAAAPQPHGFIQLPFSGEPVAERNEESDSPNVLLMINRQFDERGEPYVQFNTEEAPGMSQPPLFIGGGAPDTRAPLDGYGQVRGGSTASSSRPDMYSSSSTPGMSSMQGMSERFAAFCAFHF